MMNGEGREPVEVRKTSGLDMGKTIKWYETSGVELPRILGDLPYPIENPHLIELSDKELGGLWSLLPQNAKDRSIARKIVGQPPTWFHRDSTSGHPKPTTDRDEVLSPTAIVPSYIDYGPWAESKVPAANIWLYQIPPDAAPADIRKIILSEGFVHEVGHSIVQPALYADDHTLKLSDGRLVNGFDAMMEFAQMAEQHPPISHYASTYRGADNKFESDDPSYNVKTAVSEEACETIAAYFLGFAYCGDDTRGRDPFADRPEIEAFVKDFLNAELIREK